MSILNRVIDERFWSHRQRSTSIAGVAAAELSLLIFLYRVFFNHYWDWDLFAVGLTFAVVKLAMMTYFYLTA